MIATCRTDTQPSNHVRETESKDLQRTKHQESGYDECFVPKSFSRLFTKLGDRHASSSRSSSFSSSSSSFLELGCHQPRMSVKISFHLRVDQISLVSSIPLFLS
ncbi:uncharacterized protein LOC143428522 [Xylocopa sonorina]|uniref:uncharacterized protein LOC143428522 n=1 Tax=Xylocopa sonorina TaxID=1818115 RepID=UPI00403ACCB4